MAARTELRDALPTSHFFVTIARGRSARTLPVRPAAVLAASTCVPLLLLWFVGSLSFLVFHDDLVASLLLRQRDLQYGYEDRLAALRTQLDRDTSRQLVAQRSVESKLEELTAREAELQNRSGVVAQLERRASHLLGSGKSTNSLSASGGTAVQAEANPTSFVPQTQLGDGVAKPRPDSAVLPTERAETPAPVRRPGLPERISRLSRDLDAVTASQEARVATLDADIRGVAGRYHAALATTGLSVSRLAGRGSHNSGGPFVPLVLPDDGSPFARAAVGLQLTLSEVESLSTALAHVPLSKPLQGDPEITSPFGARLDPFLGRPAMHTGVDLSEDIGTEVLATAPGRVTASGPASGYGTMIEIDHGSGLSTRYAHLSEALVGVGQVVARGAVIGRVGSTGRATGPHLHYETRIDGDAVDPIRFMAAGQRLQAREARPL